jgi:sulfatase maturation enzyme AslB (radical SAM superfamily)
MQGRPDGRANITDGGIGTMSTTPAEIPSSHKPLPVPKLPPRLLLDLQGGFCNLKCPKCFVHGSDNSKETMKGLRGQMPLEEARKILDEVIAAKPLIHPNLWTEPLMAKNFRQHIQQMKDRGIAIALNTNGLLLTEELAQFLVDIKLDSIFISIDATTPEVLEKTRGTTKLKEIEESVFRMLKVRGEAKLPRIGVSFTMEEANEGQREEFVNKWIQNVDVVRVGEKYDKSGSIGGPAPVEKRVPCGSLYHTLPIHFNGKAAICCLDGYQMTDMGNVFERGIEDVWNGKEFTQARYYHETGQYDKVPFCENCNVWASYTYKEEQDEKDGILIRKSHFITYYNRIDRLQNYRGGGGF